MLEKARSSYGPWEAQGPWEFSSGIVRAVSRGGRKAELLPAEGLVG